MHQPEYKTAYKTAFKTESLKDTAEDGVLKVIKFFETAFTQFGTGGN